MNALGRHILVEFIGCSSEVLNDVNKIEKGMVEAASTAGATVIESNFHHFSPFGVSGVVVIQESHLAIHTWPEYQYAAVDLFTCGESVDPWIAFDFLKKVFKSQNHSALEMHRGSLSLLNRVSFKANSDAKSNSSCDAKGKTTYKRNVWFTDRDDSQALSLKYSGEPLFHERSKYQQVRVLDSLAFGKMLTINNMVMCTEKDEANYHEMIVHPGMQTLKDPRRVLVIGGGDGGTIREILRYPSVEKVTMVEIDEAVVRASKLHLAQLSIDFNNPRLDLIIGDGIEFVAKAAAESFDMIIVDGSDPVGPAEGLFSMEFYHNCQRALKQGGLLVAQGESPMFHAKAFQDLNTCLKGTFGRDQVNTYLFFIPSYPSGIWSFQMARKGAEHPLAKINSKAIGSFAKEHRLKYYNDGIHQAAFQLPGFVKQMLHEE